MDDICIKRGSKFLVEVYVRQHLSQPLPTLIEYRVIRVYGDNTFLAITHVKDIDNGLPRVFNNHQVYKWL